MTPAASSVPVIVAGCGGQGLGAGGVLGPQKKMTTPPAVCRWPRWMWACTGSLVMPS